MWITQRRSSLLSQSVLRVLVVQASIFRSTVEPSLPLRLETDVKCPWSIWSSHCVTAGLFSRWGTTWFSPGCLQQGTHSAGVLLSEPSASPPQCSISSPAFGVCTWEEAKHGSCECMHQFWWEEVPQARTWNDIKKYSSAHLKSCSFTLSWRARSVYIDISELASVCWKSASAAAAAAACWGSEDVSADMCVSQFCIYAARSCPCQPIRRLRARDKGVNLMPVTQNRWDALSVCQRSVRSVGKCLSWGGHGKKWFRLWHTGAET